MTVVHKASLQHPNPGELTGAPVDERCDCYNHSTPATPKCLEPHLDESAPGKNTTCAD